MTIKLLFFSLLFLPWCQPCLCIASSSPTRWHTNLTLLPTHPLLSGALSKLSHVLREPNVFQFLSILMQNVLWKEKRKDRRMCIFCSPVGLALSGVRTQEHGKENTAGAEGANHTLRRKYCIPIQFSGMQTIGHMTEHWGNSWCYPDRQLIWVRPIWFFHALRNLTLRAPSGAIDPYCHG